MFQHTATRRWLLLTIFYLPIFAVVSTHSHPKVAACSIAYFLVNDKVFQHTATRRWLHENTGSQLPFVEFQHTATRRWLHVWAWSLHLRWRFNTQPPEGGCQLNPLSFNQLFKFQHTATRRWLLDVSSCLNLPSLFQHTATRRWLPYEPFAVKADGFVSTHSHPKVAACLTCRIALRLIVSTHSHPKVAAVLSLQLQNYLFCFNTQPPEGGCVVFVLFFRIKKLFQHTATRRWLLGSRSIKLLLCGFNTQPPEGGCF